MDKSIEPSQVMPYPLEKSDRRHRGRSRPDYSDRRHAPRFLCHFPVSIYVGHGSSKKSIRPWPGISPKVACCWKMSIFRKLRPDCVFSSISPRAPYRKNTFHGRYTLEAQVAHRDEHGGVGVALTEPSVSCWEARPGFISAAAPWCCFSWLSAWCCSSSMKTSISSGSMFPSFSIVCQWGFI